MGELEDATPDTPAETDAERVVRHQFGFAHAAVIVGAAFVVLSLITLPYLDDSADEADQLSGPIAFAPRYEPASPDAQAEVLYYRALEEVADAKRRLSGKRKNDLAVDTTIDDAFAALDRKDVKQIEAFLAKHRAHAYAIAQGYIVQADAWRREAEWAAHDAELKKKQSEMKWDFD